MVIHNFNPEMSNRNFLKYLIGKGSIECLRKKGRIKIVDAFNRKLIIRFK